MEFAGISKLYHTLSLNFTFEDKSLKSSQNPQLRFDFKSPNNICSQGPQINFKIKISK